MILTLFIVGLLAIGALAYGLSDGRMTTTGGNVSQSTNPTNAPGTSKRP
jgi:hypothetical protein